MIVELNCNTDFVAKGADFTGAASPSSPSSSPPNGDADVASLPFEGSTVGETLHAARGQARRERRARARRALRVATACSTPTRHNQNDRGTIGVLVELGGVDPANEQAREVAHEIALHVSFAAPAYLTRDEVPADVLDRERAVIEEKSRNEGVPEAKLAGRGQGSAQRVLQGRRAARAAVGEGPEGHASASSSRASAATPSSRGSPA